MLVKLDKTLFDFLISKLNQENSETISKLNYEVNAETNTLTLDEDTADEIRDWAGEELQKVGFNKNYEITEEGEKLERIIDLFYVE